MGSLFIDRNMTIYQQNTDENVRNDNPEFFGWVPRSQKPYTFWSEMELKLTIINLATVVQYSSLPHASEGFGGTWHLHPL